MPNVSDFKIDRVEVPIAAELADEFIHLWEDTFPLSFDDFRNLAAGSEISQNRNIVYFARKDGKLAATCELTVDCANSRLGGLGGVATPPEFRGSGLATHLCQLARDEFRREGGRALFLGTQNPAARRIYRRLGWQTLPGIEAMACMTEIETPEEFLIDYFRNQQLRSISPAKASIRLPIIPLAYVPHDWQVMDANVRMFSTRCAIQRSCMSLYPRYQELIQQENANCFAAWTDDGRLVGLSTARIDETGNSQVDGFAHHSFPDACRELLQKAIDWSYEFGAKSCHTIVSIEDDQKQSVLKSLGFDETETADDFDFDGLSVGSLKLVELTRSQDLKCDASIGE